MRSKLFVPGTRPEFFAKALASEADALSFDLEDAVPDANKAEARTKVAAFLRSDPVRASGKTILVRVNAFGSAHFDADLSALAGARVDMVNLPKVEDPGRVRAAAGRCGARLLINIETPRSLARAAEIAAAHLGVAGLQVGLNDLFEPLGIDRYDPANVRAALWPIRLAAAEASRFAVDGAYPRIDDIAGFRHEAEMARGLGFIGKSCIHPSQIAIANAVFQRDDEVAQASRIVAAARAAFAEGKGAFVLDGRMVDQPAVARARALLASAESRR